MFKGTVLYVPRSEAIRHAAEYLKDIGIQTTDNSGPDVTHLLLPVPSFSSGDGYLAYILSEVPDNVIISGGNLNSALLENYLTIDFLQDPWYLAQNAAITADCALEILEKNCNSLEQLPALILGWGRIGKSLAQLLRSKGADVTVAARKTEDLATLRALGYRSESIYHVQDQLHRYRVIINTVPVLIFPNIQCHPDTLLIELASKPGMTGKNILTALGLPGKMAPERSGKLIAETFIRLSI